MPEADLSQLATPRCDAECHRLVGRDTPDTELEIVERDPAIGVGHSLDAEAEDVFDGLEGWRQCEGAEERAFLLQRSLEAQVRDFPSRGVHPFVIVLVHFFREDMVRLSDR